MRSKATNTTITMHGGADDSQTNKLNLELPLLRAKRESKKILRYTILEDRWFAKSTNNGSPERRSDQGKEGKYRRKTTC